MNDNILHEIKKNNSSQIILDQNEFKQICDKFQLLHQQDMEIKKLLLENENLKNENEKLRTQLYSTPTDSYFSWAIKKITPNPIYWKPDKECTNCTDCNIYLDVIHHCRKCGLCFCGTCSNYRKPVPDRGYVDCQRVCKNCYSS